ncbi:GntR family transcriptional regulator (plasmid) [Embleya sp. NBC_00888]|uniref:GntR family transcriptional regulator n=1 Tax=Embleya sp. NBC_00888 TaxID=2975960 RepID=UPI002F9168C6|nr:GntR family transcriptional regulator [Embleya sp. NBC_00888]
MSYETPAYQRVAADLRRQILDGTLLPGARVPSRAEISARYEVSETVALSALRLLVSEGLAEGRSGSGTYVREQPILSRLVRFPRREREGSPWAASMAGRGQAGTWSSNSATAEAPADIAARLQLRTGDRCMRTRYVFRADGAPVMTSYSYEPLEITGGQPILMPEDGPLAGRGVVERMAAIGIEVTDAEEDITARPALAEEAALLGEPAGTIVMVIRRTYCDTSGRPVETADILIPASRFSLVYRLPIEPHTR